MDDINEPDEEDFIPKRRDKTNEIFASYLAADTEGTIYSDLTGKFPVTSVQGNKYVLVVYHYDSNSIIVRPLKNRNDNETLNVYSEIYEELTAKGLQPKLHILNNKASRVLKKQIIKSKASYQLVEPHNHRVLAAECCIRTF